MTITNILLLVISVAVALLTYVAIPWLKSCINEQQLEELTKWVEIAVAAAEQVLKQPERKAFVVEFLRDKGLEFDDMAVDAAIEAAVLRLHKELDYGHNS